MSAFDTARTLDTETVARTIGLKKARERHKWQCPRCGSADGLNINTKRFGNGSKCYVCGEPMSNIDLYCWQNSLNPNDGSEALEGVRRLAQIFNFESELSSDDGAPFRNNTRLTTKGRATKHVSVDSVKPKAYVDEEREAIKYFDRLAQVEAVLGSILKKTHLSSKAKEWLEARGLMAELATHTCFRSTYGPNWRNLLDGSEEYLKLMRDAGFIGTNQKGEEYVQPWWSREFLIIPYFNRYGDVCQDMRFRRLSDKDSGPKMLSRQGTDYTSFGAEVPYLGWLSLDWATQDDLPLYVVEGELDALSMLMKSRPAVATPGTAVWHEHWTKNLEGVSEIVIVGDGDKAGREMCHRLQAELSALGGTVKISNWPEGKDANDLLLEDELDAFCEAVEKKHKLSKWAGEENT